MRLIKNAEIIIGSSAGAMILGEMVRSSKNEETFISGINLAKNSIIEPHFSEEKREENLKEAIAKNKIRYGLGIDEATALVADGNNLENYRILGNGKVKVFTYSSPS